MRALNFKTWRSSELLAVITTLILCLQAVVADFDVETSSVAVVSPLAARKR
jgi:hypothetical protein